MKKYKALAFIVLLFFTSFSTKAQDLPNVVPPSPEAAALIKHSQTDVSPYTGLPNISVPFHTISFGGVNIPVGLTYNSGGVKVEDIASWVGLGWNLNVGGLVSRTINWLPDNSPNGYMKTTNNTLADFAALDFGPVECCTPDTKMYKLLNDQQHNSDYEPDEFNYSLPDYSGKFYYDQNLNDFVQIPYTNVKIEIQEIGNRINGFTITTPDGVKYHFGGSSAHIEKIEGITGKSKVVDQNGISTFNSPASFYGNGSTPYNQSWMLRSIEFPSSQELITFNYHAQQEEITTTIRQREEYIIPFNQNPAVYTVSYRERKFTQPRIKEIVFPSGRIEFIKSTTERLDLSDDYALEKIVIYDASNKYIKGFKLHQTQSNATELNDDIPYFGLPVEATYRLKLDAVSIIDFNDNELTRYGLEYNPLKLPHRFSRSIDYFGYYNGQQNDDLLPRAAHISQLPLVLFGKANRSIDSSFTQAETLTKIIYPTGGSDEFIWENNRVKFFLEASPNLYRDYLIEKPNFFNNSDPWDSNANVYTKTFTVDPNTDGWFDFTINMSGCAGPDLNHTSCTYEIRLSGGGINEPLLQSSFRKQLTPEQTYTLTATGGTCNPVQSQDPCSDFFNVVFKYDIDPTPGEYLFGGLRIAKIKTFNDIQSTSLERTRSFDYTFFDTHVTPDLNSGMTYRLPINSEAYQEFGNTQIGSTRKIFSNAPLILDNGSYVGYEHVTENLEYENPINSHMETNGRKEFMYSVLDPYNDYQLDNEFYNFLFPPLQKKSIKPTWRNGKLQELTYFDKDSTKVKKEIYDYEEANTLHREGDEFAIQVKRGPVWNHDIKVVYYGYTTEHHRLKSQTNIDYFDTGDITTVTDYIYNNNPLLASEIKTTTSDSKPIISKVFYSNDVTSNSSLGFDNLSTSEFDAIEKLQSPSATNLTGQHRINTPIQTEIYKDLNNDNTADANELLNVNRTNYNEDSVTGFVQPEIIQTGKGSSPNLEDRIQFHSYDNYGNPLEVSKVDGTRIMYIWGYNDTVPIAKIENASFQGLTFDINTAITAAELASNNDDDNCREANCKEEQLREALNTLRSLLPQAMVSTYTYDPLIGVTSMTDPRGNTTYYKYDDFNRLEYVKDQDGNILSENKYNYRTQN